MTTIRSARLDDCRRLAEIDAAGNPSPWSEKQFQAALNSPYGHIAVWEHRGQAAAFIVWQTLCGESELHLLATAPEYRRRGAASALLDEWFGHGRTQSCTRLFLEVRDSNAAARHLYLRHGFTECGRRKNYYPIGNNKREDAVLMEKIC